MITLVFEFTSGRYHATPWGAHVNEGLVEWPPSPWRVMRAIVANAFTKAHVPDPVPPDHPLRRIVAALCSELPMFRLPRGIATHSRHYMPGEKDSTSLVIDASAVLGSSPVAVSWNVELDGESRALLDTIATRVGYLGRAESWVEGRLLAEGEPLPDGDEVVPHHRESARRGGWEEVSVLAPMDAPAYLDWHERTARELLSDLPLPPAGKKPTKALETRRMRALEPLPPDLLAALCMDSAWHQRHGWSQPPGSRRILYRRPTDTLSTRGALRTRRATGEERAEAVVLSVMSQTTHGDVLPRLFRALPQAELLHRSLVSQAGRGRKVDCPELTGLDAAGAPLRGHRHVHVIPYAMNRRSAIDHILLWAPMGFGRRALDAIHAVHKTWTKDGAGDLLVTVAGIGTLGDVGPLLDPRLVGPARVWESRTPFVPPRHLKRNRHTMPDQVRDELVSREIVPAELREFVEVEFMVADDFVMSGFHKFICARSDPRRAPPAEFAVAVRLTFPQPVCGPISLGYASHFGLGSFAVSSEQPDPT